MKEDNICFNLIYITHAIEAIRKKSYCDVFPFWIACKNWITPSLIIPCSTTGILGDF